MRVAVLGPSYPFRGGISHYTTCLFRQFREEGHDTRYFAFSRQYPKFLFPGLSDREPAASPYREDAAERVLDGCNPLSVLKTALMIRKWKPDLLVFPWWHAYWAPHFLCILKMAGKNVRKVAICHNSNPHEKGLGNKLAMKSVLGSAGGIIAHSKAEEQNIKELLPSSIVEVCFHPIYDQSKPTRDRDEVREELGIDGKALIFFGFIRPYKGLDILLDAMPVILKKEPKTKLLVVGEFWGDTGDAIKQQIEDLGIGKSVILRNEYVSEEELANYLAASDLAVFPYRSVTGSGALLTALGHGLPVVASDIGCFSEMLYDWDGTELVHPDDTETLADSILRLLNKRKKADQIATRASRRFSWESMVAEIKGCPASSELARKKILLTGTYSSFNKGDAAMELSMTKGLARVMPETHVTISAPFPEIDAPFYAPVEVEKTHRRNLILSTLLLMHACICRLLRPLLGRKCFERMLLSEELRIISRSNLVVDLSGDMLTEDYGLHVAYSHYLPLLLAWAIGVPYMICAQSIGKFKFSRWLALLLLNHAAKVTVREPVTDDYLREIGFSGHSLTADLAIGMEPAPPGRVASIIAEEGLPFSKSCLGVSMSSLLDSHYSRLNDRSRKISFESLLSQTLDDVSERRGLTPVFFSHVTGPSKSKDDRLISRKIADNMQTHCHVIQGDYRPEELKGLIGKCKCFVGARMHANIAALSSNVPVVALSYSQKAPGIMKMYGMEQLLCPASSLSKDVLIQKIDLLLDDLDGFTQVLRGKNEEIGKQSEKNIRLVKQLACA